MVKFVCQNYKGDKKIEACNKFSAYRDTHHLRLSRIKKGQNENLHSNNLD